MIYFDIILNKKMNYLQLFYLAKKFKFKFFKSIFSKEKFFGNENIKIFYMNKRLTIKCPENQIEILLKEICRITKLGIFLLNTRGRMKEFKNIANKYKVELV